MTVGYPDRLPKVLLPPLLCLRGHFKRKTVAASLALVCLSLIPASAQNGAVAPKPVEHSTQADSSRLADESAQKGKPEKTAQKAKKKRRVPEGILFAPIPISSPAIGSGVVLAGGYIFQVSKADKVSPPSTAAGAYFATDNGTRGFALGGEFFLRKNLYHITSIYAHGNINYDFFGVGVDAGAGGAKLPLKQTGQVFLGEFLYRFRWKFFLGPRVLAGSSTITLRSPTESPAVPPPPDIGVQTQLTGLGFRVNRDTRSNRFYPSQGQWIDFVPMFFSESLGSKYSFESYRFTFNTYRSMTKSQVLAYDGFICATSGEPPFYGECIFGTNNELRGYIAGKHIDLYMIATQLEYRLALPWRLGVTAFGGLGEVAPSIDQFKYDNLLPAFGGGLRLRLSKKYGVNLRADIGRGRDGHTFSMGIGEAF